MSKLAANDDGTNKSSSNQRYFKAKEEDREEMFMTNIITTREMIKLCIDQVVEIEEFHLVVEFSVDKITEVDQGMNKAIGMTLDEETLDQMREHIKIRILGDRIIEVDTEEIIGMKI